MTDWDMVMCHIDAAYLQDALSTKEAKTVDFEKEKTMYNYKMSGRKLGRGLLAAAVVAVMLTCIAFAANIFGIREMFSRSGRQLPDQAVSEIQQHRTEGTGTGWDCVVTESLSDASTVLVTVTVTSDEYVLVPTDAQPEDPLASIGLAGGGTLGDYAAEQGKKLLLVGAGIAGVDDLGIHTDAVSFEPVSDGEMVILIHATKSESAEIADAVCIVTAVEPGCDMEDVQRVELPFMLKESATQNGRMFLVSGNQVVSGVEFSQVRIAETALGLNLELPVTIVDKAAFDKGVMLSFEGLTYSEGGFVMEDDGSWTGRYPMCQGTVDGELKVLVYDWDKQLLGEIVFVQQ